MGKRGIFKKITPTILTTQFEKFLLKVEKLLSFKTQSLLNKYSLSQPVLRDSKINQYVSLISN